MGAGAGKGTELSVALGQWLGTETSTLTKANATAGAVGATVAITRKTLIFNLLI
jgi:hypothetical protein